MRRLLLLLGMAFCLLAGTSGISAAGFYSGEDLAAYLASHPSPMKGKKKTIPSNLHELKSVWYPLPESSSTGGAIVMQDDILIIVSPSGEISWVALNELQGPYITTIAAPMNTAALVASGLPETSKMNMGWYRAAGAYAEIVDDKLRLYVAHHAFENGCIYLQLSAVDLKFDREKGLYQQSDWSTLFKPSPCVHIGDASRKPFAGMQAGGRIVSLDDTNLLVAYGDHEIDGLHSANAPQDPNSPYGKIWKVAKDGSGHSLYASGVRNPQGLFMDNQRRVWETEHGPQGGDELNLIVEGANYGWPMQTYGVDYGGFEWPLDPVQGDHSNPKFDDPVFSWIPSIAPTDITQVDGRVFDLWKGDLIVATLKDEALHRLRLSGDAIAYDERIEVGRRLRDIVTAPDGRLLILDDSQNLGIVTAGERLAIRDPANDKKGEEVQVAEAGAAKAPGEELFALRCASCHSLNGDPGVGPSLAGLTHRGVGDAIGFTYSADLASSEAPWDLKLFVSYIINPQQVFPSSKMTSPGVTAEEAGKIYEHLSSLGGKPEVMLAQAGEGEMAVGADQTDKPRVSPFIAEFATGEARKVKAYEELTPGFWVGFDEAKATSILVQQKPDDTHIGGAESKYLVAVDVKDAAGSEWITVERTIDKAGSSRVVVNLTARMAKPAQVEFVLFIPQKEAPPERVDIGTANIGTDFKSFIFEKSIDLQNYPNTEAGYPSRIVALLPTESGVSLELARFDIFSF